MKIIGSNEKKFLQYFSDADSVAAQKIVRQVYMIDYNRFSGQEMFYISGRQTMKIWRREGDSRWNYVSISGAQYDLDSELNNITELEVLAAIQKRLEE
ncbi:hypothetical protein [uncultured Megasphaera sp.]|uniref:hypothetical protein n=1 Tax=uncultured Megasphaera sp. TaxID=165188 RepID=UPI0025D13E2A|nr:hypothetical protein [uncultured Megasphaera sp.]